MLNYTSVSRTTKVRIIALLVLLVVAKYTIQTWSGF
jgi:hypothetical protein